MFSLEGRTYVVTGGHGHLGLAIIEGIWKAGGGAIVVSPNSPGLKYPADAFDKEDFALAIQRINEDWGDITGLVNIVGDIEICTEAVKDQVSVIANCTSLWSELSPNPSMYLDLGNEPSPAIVGDKGTRLALTRYYASFLAPKVRVNSFSPGWFPKKRGPERPDYIKEITSRTPLGRIGVPDDIVGTVLFLLSDASKFMTGQNLVVDGGYSIW